MDYDPSDSSGTDDDLPPLHQNRNARGSRVIGNGRAPLTGSLSFGRPQSDMESQIHLLEQEAYCSVLRAFKAQSDAITWEKEGLITELRKELRVSDDEHRELLNKVNANDIIRRIREWRKAGGSQAGLLNMTHPIHDQPSPSVSASRKKQKTSQSIQSLNAASPALHPQNTTSMPPSTSVVKRGAGPVGARGKKSKSGQGFPGGSTLKSLQYQSSSTTGRGQNANRGISGAPIASGLAEATTFDPLIGRKVKTRWPEDNNFYEAVITDYNPEKGLHALVYDINTADETWEWVNLKEISPEDIQWEGENPGISRCRGRAGPGRGNKKNNRGASLSLGKGRGALKSHTKQSRTNPDFLSSQNGMGKRTSDDIEILHTDTLIKEVERVFSATHPDPQDVEKAKKVLKEQEQALVDAISKLADASDGESEEGEHPFSQSIDRDRGWRNRHTLADFKGEMVEEGHDDGSDGENHIVRDDGDDGDDGNDI